MNYTFTFGRQTWTEPNCCSFGDYGGDGSVGRANIGGIIEEAGNVICMSYGDLHDFIEYTEKRRKPYYQTSFEELVRTAKLLRDRPDVLHITGAYGSERVLIREGWEQGADILAALADYPVLDDEAVTRVEMQWEEEAWESYVCGDIERALSKHSNDGDVQWNEYWDSLPETDAWEIYRAAMETTNTDPVPEHNGVYIDIDAIFPAIRKMLQSRFADEQRKAREVALQTYHSGQQTLIADCGLPDPEGVGAAAAAEFTARFI